MKYSSVLVRLCVGFTLILALSPSTLFAADKLVVYSGRAERLITPVLDAFTEKTHIKVQLLTGSSTQLINRLQAEGAHTQADVFLTMTQEPLNARVNFAY